jgi:hypothetical protein
MIKFDLILKNFRPINSCFNHKYLSQEHFTLRTRELFKDGS